MADAQQEITIAGPFAVDDSRRVPRVVCLRRNIVREIQPYLYLLPGILATAVWVYWPLIGTLRLSFFRWNLLPTRPMEWRGLANYARILTLPEMRAALGNTAIYIVGLLPFSVILPAAIAIGVAGIKGRARTAYRAIIFAPVLVAPVVVSIVWRWILHPTHGISNVWLRALIGGEGINWFRDPRLAIWAIIGIAGWKFLGFSVLLFSAGLSNISKDYYDAALVDGAGALQTVWYVTLPLLSPTIAFMMFMTVLLGANWVFPMINVLTQGGPLSSTTNIFYLLWELGFRSFNIGLSSAAAIVFFVLYLVIAFLLFRLSDRYSFFDS